MAEKTPFLGLERVFLNEELMIERQGFIWVLVFESAALNQVEGMPRQHSLRLSDSNYYQVQVQFISNIENIIQTNNKFEQWSCKAYFCSCG